MWKLIAAEVPSRADMIDCAEGVAYISLTNVGSCINATAGAWLHPAKFASQTLEQSYPLPTVGHERTIHA